MRSFGEGCEGYLYGNNTIFMAGVWLNLANFHNTRYSKLAHLLVLGWHPGESVTSHANLDNFHNISYSKLAHLLVLGWHPGESVTSHALHCWH